MKETVLAASSLPTIVPQMLPQSQRCQSVWTILYGFCKLWTHRQYSKTMHQPAPPHATHTELTVTIKGQRRPLQFPRLLLSRAVTAQIELNCRSCAFGRLGPTVGEGRRKQSSCKTEGLQSCGSHFLSVCPWNADCVSGTQDSSTTSTWLVFTEYWASDGEMKYQRPTFSQEPHMWLKRAETGGQLMPPMCQESTHPSRIFLDNIHTEGRRNSTRTLKGLAEVVGTQTQPPRKHGHKGTLPGVASSTRPVKPTKHSALRKHNV